MTTYTRTNNNSLNNVQYNVNNVQPQGRRMQHKRQLFATDTLIEEYLS